VLIKGSFGIGKSFFTKIIVKELLEENDELQFKYGEGVKWVFSLLDPNIRGLKMNGARIVAKEIFQAVAERKKR
jgi:chromosomal replication initiation ATPase DnaA